VIIWINGGFGAGKSTLAAELVRRVPDAVLFDPEYVGYTRQQSLPTVKRLPQPHRHIRHPHPATGEAHPPRRRDNSKRTRSYAHSG
jgi:hypothetical protein